MTVCVCVRVRVQVLFVDEMTSTEGADSIELECETLFSSKNKDIHSSTLKSTSDENGKEYNIQFRPPTNQQCSCTVIYSVASIIIVSNWKKCQAMQKKKQK